MNRWAKLLLVASFSLIPSYQSIAQVGDAIPEVANSKNQFLGEVSKSSQIFSGPGETYYPTFKLEKGATVTVVGKKFEWLKIIPPEGSFSVVAKSFVDKTDDSTGVINGDKVNVRAGSSLIQQKTTRQCQLQRGDKVQIVGEVDEYYMIKPPQGAYLYVKEDSVDPVKVLGENPVKPAVAVKGPDTQPVKNPGEEIKPATADNPVEKNPIEIVKVEPKIDFAALAREQLQKLEVEAKNADGLTLADRPYPQLIESYSELLKKGQLSGFDKQLAEARLTVLNMKNKQREEYVQMMASLEKSGEKLDKIQQDRARIDQKLAQGVTLFSAVGVLQTSALQNAPGQTVYRLTDPTTSRTVCYIRTTDANVADLMNTFVGVDGTILTDAEMTLKIINASAVVKVDPDKVNNGVAAQLIPASMLPKSGASASTEEPH